MMPNVVAMSPEILLLCPEGAAASLCTGYAG